MRQPTYQRNHLHQPHWVLADLERPCSLGGLTRYNPYKSYGLYHLTFDLMSGFRDTDGFNAQGRWANRFYELALGQTLNNRLDIALQFGDRVSPVRADHQQFTATLRHRCF